MSAAHINCYKDQQFQTRIQIPGTNGVLRNALTGEVTLVKLRLSATATGAAINAAVGTLAAAENSAAAHIQYVVVDTALLVTHVLPLGVGASFWAIWSKSGDFDYEATEFIVWDRTAV